jgi:hypothetical protein
MGIEHTHVYSCLDGAVKAVIRTVAPLPVFVTVRASLGAIMVSPEERAAQAEALAGVERARVERDDAARRYRLAIVRAVRRGASPTDVAAAAGVTRARVYQIVDEANTTDG